MNGCGMLAVSVLAAGAALCGASARPAQSQPAIATSQREARGRPLVGYIQDARKNLAARMQPASGPETVPSR